MPPNTSSCYLNEQELEHGTVKFAFKPCASPKDTVVVFTGFNAKRRGYLEWMADVSADNHNLLTVPLPSAEDADGFYRNYENAISDFITDPNSPLFKLVDPSLPKKALAHSSGGLCIQTLMHNDTFKAKMEDTFSSLVNVAPFWNATGGDTAFSRKAYDWHARRHPDKIAGSMFVDKAFCYIKNGKPLKSNDYFDPPPTHGQILTLLKHGEILRTEGLVKTSFPQALYIGTNEPFVCTETVRRLSKDAGHTIISAVRAHHNPLLEDTDQVKRQHVLNGDFEAAANSHRHIRTRSEKTIEFLRDSIAPKAFPA